MINSKNIFRLIVLMLQSNSCNIKHIFLQKISFVVIKRTPIKYVNLIFFKIIKKTKKCNYETIQNKSKK